MKFNMLRNVFMHTFQIYIYQMNTKNEEKYIWIFNVVVSYRKCIEQGYYISSLKKSTSKVLLNKCNYYIIHTMDMSIYFFEHILIIKWSLKSHLVGTMYFHKILKNMISKYYCI
jgi:hypothetical protein